ncbi:hypothetical protein T261_1604 [Streptomyces lydicus]|nr:hypothetical protein T261_1604 [Streptomyces lydicus]
MRLCGQGRPRQALKGRPVREFAVLTARAAKHASGFPVIVAQRFGSKMSLVG